VRNLLASAGLFFRAGLIEAWGRGIEKIGETCRRAGVPAPHYRIKPNEVMIGFDANIGDGIGDATGDATGDANDAASDATGDASDAVSDVTGDVTGDAAGDAIGEPFIPNPTQKEILALMHKNPTISATAIAATVRIAKRNVWTNIKLLKEAGLVERTGFTSNGRWILKENRV
jgi:ATP-dependent DNA helicase RecG